LNSTFSDNLGSDGGAIACGGALVVRNSTFSGNRAEKEEATTAGGAIYGWRCDTEVTGSTFVNNSTSHYGGAIHVYESTMAITNSTIHNNLALTGGALSIQGGSVVTATNITIAGNRVSEGGSASGVSYMGSGSTFIPRNTIIANNTGDLNCAGTGAITDGGNNLRFPASDASCVGSFGDPELAPLANNGGPTETMALPFGSAALNRIPPENGCGFGIASDQRGVSRPQGIGCDIGAFELQTPTIPSMTQGGVLVMMMALAICTLIVLRRRSLVR
jgi:predicted outer membrane repeat protein